MNSQDTECNSHEICRNDRKDIIVSPYDIYRIARHLNRTTSEIVRLRCIVKTDSDALEEHCEIPERATELREEMTGMENEGICV